MYLIHLVYFKRCNIFFIYQWKKLDINLKKKNQQTANKFPWKSVMYIVHPRKEEGQDSFHPLSWVSSNTEPTQGWREKATFKKEYVIKWGVYYTPS